MKYTISNLVLSRKFVIYYCYYAILVFKLRNPFSQKDISKLRELIYAKVCSVVLNVSNIKFIVVCKWIIDITV